MTNQNSGASLPEHALTLELYDHWMRIALEIPDVRKETFPGLVRFTRPAPGMNFVSYSRLEEAELDSTIQDQVNYFLPLNQPFEWLVYEHDQPQCLKERLLAQGFSDDDDPDAVMVLDLRQYSPTPVGPTPVGPTPVSPTPVGPTPVGPTPVGKTDFKICKLTRRDQLADVISVEQQVLGGDFSWINKRLGDHLEIPGYLSVYVAYLNEKPVSTGWIYFHPNNLFATLNGGATIPEFRQHGVYTTLVHTRLLEAKERGRRFISTDASPFSQPILEQNGFNLLTRGFSIRWSGKTTP